MKNSILILIVAIAICSCKRNTEGNKALEDDETVSELSGIDNWFSAWELVSKDVFAIDSLLPVEFVFFDEAYVYSTSEITISNDSLISGPNLLNTNFVWRKKGHDGNIKLPDGQTLPIGIMSFAAPLENQRAQAYFVMPLPEFWKKAGVTSEELGLKNLITGVFLHEFAHTQQMQNFGADISEFENTYSFEYEFSDDIVQNYFEKDSVYTKKFRNEIALFYQASVSNDASKRNSLAKQALTLYKKRQNEYFVDNLRMLPTIDDLFLSMEGVGQYAMYSWLIHPLGGNLSSDTAEKGVRRGGKWWSQEEGLALFLVLEKYAGPEKWSNMMFGNESGSAIGLLETELSKIE